jgi:predicted dehydrogenase
VVCEKPPGRNRAEAEQMAIAARKAGRILKIGFNHRYHPAILKARERVREGAIGPVMFIRSIYGHGGRPGYDKEWRANANLSGGGELLDQGVHVIDLCRWFIGEFVDVFAVTGTYAWDLGSFPLDGPTAAVPSAPAANRRLEDNAFAVLRAPGGQVAQFHTSWTQWKNRFSFEVFGQEGSVAVEGLGGSYGTETLVVTRRQAEGGMPQQETEAFPGSDNSWRLDWEDFAEAIRTSRQPMVNGEDGVRTMRVVEALYESAWTGRVIRL